MRFTILLGGLFVFTIYCGYGQGQCTISGLESAYCENDQSPIKMTFPPNISPNSGENASGGVVTGTGVTTAGGDVYFNPSLAGEGSYTIEYRSYEVVQNTSSYEAAELSTSTDLSLERSGSPPIALGFTFKFLGKDYNDLYVSPFGFLSFSSGGLGAWETYQMPNEGEPNNIIAFAWDQWDPAAAGSIKYETLGSAPKRVFVLEYNKVPHAINTIKTITAQVKLFEGTNVIEIHTEHLAARGESRRVQGIEGEPYEGNNVIGGGKVEWYAVPGRNKAHWTVRKTKDFVSFTPCTTSQIVKVYAHPTKNKPVSANAPAICSGESTTIDVDTEVFVSYQLQRKGTGGGDDVDFVDFGDPKMGTGGTIQLHTGKLTATTEFQVVANQQTKCQAVLTQTATVTVNPLPSSPEIKATPISCHGRDDGRITLEGQEDIEGQEDSSPYTYELEDDEGNKSADEDVNKPGVYTDLSAGVYKVTVTDQKKCTAFGNIEISEPDELTVSDGVTSNYHGYGVSCHGSSDGRITVEGKGGSSPYTYELKKDDKENEVVNKPGVYTSLSAGKYELTVTDKNNCTNKQEIEITQPAEVIADISFEDESICKGQGTDITFTLKGNGKFFDVIYSDGTKPFFFLPQIQNGHKFPVSPTATTTYALLSVTDLATSCTRSFSNIKKKVTVLPSPVTKSALAFQTVCSNSPIEINLDTDTKASSVQDNLWDVSLVSRDDKLEGEASAGQNLPSDAIREDKFKNIDNNPSEVVYKVIPKSKSCSGEPFRLTVKVSPHPVGTVENKTEAICSGETTDIHIQSKTKGAIIKLIEIKSSSSQLVGLPAVESTYLNGANLGHTITNPTHAAQTIDYKFQVSVNGCTNTDILETLETRVTIKPIPDVALSVPAQTICDGSVTDIGLTSPNAVSGTTYSWRVVQTDGITGAEAGSGGSKIAQPLSNATNSPGTATYSVTPSAGGCKGVAKIIIVTVNPTPTMQTTGDEIICSGATTNITLNSKPENVAGTTYSWRVIDNINTVTGATNGAGTIIAQNLFIDPNSGAGSVTYPITPKANGCDGTPVKVKVTVNPIPIVNAGFDYQVCEDGQILLTSSLSGAAVSAKWTGGNNSLSGYSNVGNPVANDENITYTFNQADINAGSVTFTLTTNDPDGTGPCIAVSDQITVTINKLPVVTLSVGSPNLAEIGELASPVLLLGTPSGGTFSGDGVHGNTFKPLEATLNKDNFVTYTYTDINSCTNSVKNTIFVKGKPPLPNLTESAICFNNDPVMLPQLILGETGEWSGTGVTVDGEGVYRFTPTEAGVGGHVVRFDITVNGSSNFAEQSYVVIPSAVADFDVLNFCVEDDIKFRDKSTVDSGIYPSSVVTWDWNFGDHTRSSLQNTSNKYPRSGDYTVVLKLKTETKVTINGILGVENCFVEVTKDISVGAKPTAKFEWKGVCGGVPTEFADITVLNGAVIKAYVWDFGDGSPFGILKNLSHQYAKNGIYDVKLTVDTDKGCRDVLIQRIGILPKISAGFPYRENFESDNGGWVSGADVDPAIGYESDTSWIYGVPDGSNIASPGNKAWWTGKNMKNTGKADATYFANESSYVNGPCFDLSSLKRPMIAMDIWVDVQKGFDGVVLQYSTGNEWVNVGFIDKGLHWYDGQGIPGMARNQLLGRYGWTQNTNGWVSARFSLEHIPVSDRESVRFRIAFGSDANTPTSEIHNGFAFDNIFIGDKTRNVLVEHFTNANTNGAEANKHLYNIFDQQLIRPGGTTDFVLLQYHLGVPNADPLYEDNVEDSGARALFYGFAEGPRTIMDGLPEFSGNTFLKINETGIDILSLKDPVFSIGLENIPSDINEIKVKTVLTANKAFDEQLILHIGIVENEIILGSDTYRSVLRKLLYGGDGKVVTETWDAGSVGQQYTASWKINRKIYDGTQLGIVAFVQNKQTKEVYQVAYLKAGNKERGVVTGILEESGNVAKAMKIYPNPVGDYLTIVNTYDQAGDYYWEIVDQRGVKILSDNMNFRNGEYRINTSTIPNGVYYVVIGIDGKPMTYHKIAVAGRR